MVLIFVHFILVCLLIKIVLFLISIFLCFALVPRTVDFHWYLYRILKFLYRDNSTRFYQESRVL